MKKQLSKSDVKELNTRLAAAFGREELLDKKDRIESYEDAECKLILVNGTPALFERAGTFVPHLRFLLLHPAVLPHVTVDMGAVRFVTSGADVMRPGITAIADGIKQDDLVAVVDQNHKKPLAVCEALVGSDQMRAMDKGKVLRNLHHVGDALWTAEF